MTADQSFPSGETEQDISVTATVGLVAIGRNEGDRLKRCLRSIPAECPAVYVDSGSTDDSVAFAKSIGVTVVQLEAPRGFTAALARNAGWRRLLEDHPSLELVQFVDGDCELNPDWIDRGQKELGADGRLCAVFGRRRERFPSASPYNALCDDEWDVPVGLAQSCGGDVLFRVDALVRAGGYSDDLIAGEEPDLCLRLGREGWLIRRIDAEMTLHDANIHAASQNWKRMRRSGHAFAEHVARHGEGAFPDWRRQVRSFTFWALVVPIGILGAVIAALVSGWLGFLIPALLGVLLYPMQVLRIARARMRDGASRRFALTYGLWMVLGKFAQFGGALRYYGKRRKGEVRLIEYKA